MPSLESLPAEIVEEIAQYLDVPPKDCVQHGRHFHSKNDLLALVSASRRAREILFDRTWVKQHVMGFASSKLTTAASVIDLARRSQVEYVSRKEFDSHPSS
jgi:hypothetical protein